MASLQYSENSNFQVGTLTSAYTSGGGTLSLTSGHGARFPSSGDYWVRVDDEIFKVTARSGDTLTVTGAQGSTSASNHSSGSTVRWVLTGGALDQMRADLVQTGTYANLPSASAVKPGTIYVPSDSAYDLIRSDGSSWSHFKKGFLMTPPLTTGWSWVNQGSAVLTTSGGYTNIEAPASGTDQVRIRTRTAPSTPYTVTCHFTVTWPGVNFGGGGVGWRQSSDGKLVLLKLGTISGQQFIVRKADAAAPVTSYATYVATSWYPADIWVKFTDNGTNRIVSVSADGAIYTQIHSVGRTDYLTADQIMMFSMSVNSSYNFNTSIDHWKET